MANTSQIEFKPLTIEELKLTEEFNNCTEKQRLWIRTFIESNGDYLFATRAAYNSKSKLNAHILSHKVRRCPEVIAAVRLCLPDFGDVRADRDVILDALQRKLLQSLRNRKSVLSVAEKDMVNKLFAEKGWDLPQSLRRSLNTHGHATAFMPESKSESKPEGCKVGDVVTQNGIQYRVIAVDADGKPVAAEEV